MFQDIITKYVFVIIGYELITMDIVKAKLIDILLDKIIYVIILLIMSFLGLVFNSILCCVKYSPEEKEILKLIKAGDKMNKLNGKGDIYYIRARNKINSSLPFTEINDKIISKMEKIEINMKSRQLESKKRKTKAN